MVKKKENTKNNHKKRSNSGIYFFLGIIVLVIIVLVIVFSSKGKDRSYPQDQIDSFAKCLTEKGVIMYGTFWCPNCARTKARFGSSFKYINYVECDPNGKDQQAELCVEKKIENYDTWIFTSGKWLVGEPTFEQIAKESDCPLGEN